MIAAPMLADFAIRLAFGLAISILMISRRSVPLPFFRTQAHVILGLLVLAALDQARAGGWMRLPGSLSPVRPWRTCRLWRGGWASPISESERRLSPLSPPAVGWRSPPGRPSAGVWSANASSRLASGFLVGATLSAMLLGHYYLTAPAMTLEPLKRVVALIALGLGALPARGDRPVDCAGRLHGAGALPIDPDPRIFLAVRWGLGFVAAAISTYMTWKTAEIRSTQSATGILYITMIFVLFGELTSLVLAGRDGVIC